MRLHIEAVLSRFYFPVGAHWRRGVMVLFIIGKWNRKRIANVINIGIST
jgi:hypothetical protein